ncbi:RIP metalloprotease RseP [Bacillus subtilis]|uniref:RIP metalloprotease RseP n=1 Tax=Pseudochrobactrum asaccharolyticum TaxID=354351 RepID=UPI001F030DC6|nr:RIP metalloprotease RseP [Pseudochrobactrum asaccharolyticum]MCF7671295.1 RIP metalloprotease RseP [Bacillus subtilis]
MSDPLGYLFGGESLLVGTLLPFILVLAVVVFVHEMGHFIVGRLCGIGVQAFSIGFGPELIGYTARNGTRWKLCAIPLGGYVKFVGDLNAASAPDGQGVAAMSEAERKVAFPAQPVWKRAATVFAGPAFNFLLTIAILSFFFASYGRMVADPTIAEVNAGSPAAIAGFKPGDRFINVEGSEVTTFSDVQRIVNGRSGDELSFTVEREGRQIELKAVPELMEQTDALGNKIKLGVIGVSITNDTGNFRRIEYSPLESVGAAVVETGHIISRTGTFMKRLVMGREDKCQLGGPVKIANMAGQAAQHGFEWLVQLIAMLSVGIGLFNLFPLPPLDGGHLVIYAGEAVLGRPVPVAVQELFFRLGFFVVIGFMGFVFYNDLFGC